MARTLTIHDDALGAQLTVRIEQGPKGSRISDIHFMADDGATITSAAFDLLGALGVPLPDRPQPATKPAPPPTAAKKVAAKKAPPKKPAKRAAIAPAPRPPAEEPDGDLSPNALPTGARPALPAGIAAPRPPAAAPTSAAPAEPEPNGGPPRQRKERRTGPPPSREQLREAFRRTRGDYQSMADEFDASLSSVIGWVRKAREAGFKINLDGLPDLDVDEAEPQPAGVAS